MRAARRAWRGLGEERGVRVWGGEVVGGAHTARPLLPPQPHSHLFCLQLFFLTTTLFPRTQKKHAKSKSFLCVASNKTHTKIRPSSPISFPSPLFRSLFFHTQDLSPLFFGIHHSPHTHEGGSFFSHCASERRVFLFSTWELLCSWGEKKATHSVLALVSTSF